MRLPVSRDVLEHELQSTVTLLQRWLQVVQNTGPIADMPSNGFPAMDFPAGEELFDEALQQMSRELVLCAGKCESLADLLYSGSRRG